MSNRHNRVWIAALLTCTALQLVFVGSARAGWTIEAGGGWYHDQNELAPAATVDRGKKGTKIYLGYQLSDYLGFQVGAVDFAPMNFTDTGGQRGQAEMSGPHAKVYLNVPFSRDNDGYTGLHLSGGGWRWERQESSDATGTTTRESGQDITAGVGLIFKGKTGAVLFEYERYFLSPTPHANVYKKGAGSKEDLQFDLISLNFVFYF